MLVVLLITSKQLSNIIGLPWVVEVSQKSFETNLTEIRAVFEILKNKLEEVFGAGALTATFKVEDKKFLFSFGDGKLKIQEI